MSIKKMSDIAVQVDNALASIDSKVDWLSYLSPVDNDANWQTFKVNKFSKAPVLRYLPIPENYSELLTDVRNIPIDDVNEPALQALFSEKRMELELQIDLVQNRNTEGFLPISIELFGAAEPSLLQTANDILGTVSTDGGDTNDGTCDDLVAAAMSEFKYYRSKVEDFTAKIEVMDDLNSMMMVHNGDFKIARSVKIPLQRIRPLIAHEVGTHVVTRYNGRCQPIKLLEHGMAHYDPLQEGLGTLSEYLAGYLPPERLRTIAARVVATHLAIQGSNIQEIFSVLHYDHDIPEETAFDVAVRACRGGGLTKDTVYLRGLGELLAYLAEGGDLAFLYLGKFSMGQRFTVQKLLDQDSLVPAKLLPRHLLDEKCLERLARVRNLELKQLYQEQVEI